MADTTALKNRINAAIKANDNQEITGPVLQQSLLDIVDELNGATETEASARQNGDSTLQQNINNEAIARNNADTALNTLIKNSDNFNVVSRAAITFPSDTSVKIGSECIYIRKSNSIVKTINHTETTYFDSVS